ncbi:Thiamine transporter 2, partial [Nibea albiflora]
MAEPFLTPYLIGPHKNISGEVLTNYLFPIWTYSYLAFLFPVFLLTDFLRHKPLIMIQGLFLVMNYVLLCFAPGLPAMICLQVNYAIVTSTEVAYLSYIYSVIPVENYQRATGYLRSAMLSGYTFGAGLGQMLVSLAGVDLFHINAITLGIVSMALLISFWLPMPQRSLFFKGKKAAAVGSQSQQEGPLGLDRPEEPKMYKDEAGSGREKMEHNGNAGLHLIYWSLWWALASAGYGQIFNYIQLMWDHIEPSATSSIYNGGVEAVCSLVGAAAAFSVGYIKVNWAVWGELALGLFSAVATSAVFLMALTSSIWLCYAGYAIFKSCYMLLITITAFQIASNLSMECYALTFGINTFVALFLQTIITFIFVDEAALGLNIVAQFIIYGSYYALISVLFLIRGTYTAWTSQRNPEHTENTEQEPSVEVTNHIFPVWTYSYICVLVPVFLLTDWLRYKPVVVFQCVNMFITSALLLWVQSVPAMQVMQFFCGVVAASEVAYFSYIYSVIDLKRYRKATSHSRSAHLLGNTVGSVLGQLLVSFNLMSYNNLLVFTLVLSSTALLISCLLPMPQQSMYFHRKHTGQKTVTESPQRHEDGTGDATEHLSVSTLSMKGDEYVERRGETEDEAEKGQDEKSFQVVDSEDSVGAETCGKVLLRLWRDFRQCYSSRHLLYWSVWWAMATCGYNQVFNYVQVLWEDVQPSQNFTVYNGGVEAASNLFGAAAAYSIGFTEVRWEQWGELALGGFSGLGAVGLFLMTFMGNIWVCYIGYIIFKFLYMLLITIAMYQIAADLTMERYALVFGANNFGALVLQTIITFVVVDSRGLGLGIITQVSV